MNTPRPRALIADDEPHLARALQSLLARQWPELEVVHLARNGSEAAAQIAALEPELAFLDIQMPGLTGLEVAQGIEGRTRVVFVTAYDAYAVQAFEQEALDYLLKPVTEERLARTLQRVRRALAAPGPGAAAGGPAAPGAGAASGDPHDPSAAMDDARLLNALRRLLPPATPTAPPTAPPGGGPLRWIRASAGPLTHQVPVAEITCFQADDKYTCVHTVGGDEHLIRTPIAELAQQLDPQQFVQVHRSTIVNLEQVAGTRRDEASRLFLRLRGLRRELPVSRAYVHLFRAM
jgi:DNA-binding LytR/AlgR family response regulator